MPKNDRRCVSCRKIGSRSEFWRVVRCHPSKEVQIDLGMICLQGRSAYLCQTAECLELAQKKNRLGRSLKTPICDRIYHELKLKINLAISNSTDRKLTHQK